MNKEEVQMLGFEIVAYAGDARSKLLIALAQCEKGEFDKVDGLLAEANELILHAHKAQTSMLQAEASGEEIPYSFTMNHGQDHLMTTMLLKDTIGIFINILKKQNGTIK